MSGGLNTILAAVPTTSKLNDQLTGVGQLRAILIEGNFTGLALCESKDLLRTEGIRGELCCSACTRRYRYTAHIKLIQRN
jgi:hypothetical protein